MGSIISVSLLVACGGSPPPPAAPPEPAPVKKPEPPPPPPEPEPSAEPEPEAPPPEPAAPEKPKSTATIGGTSLSDVSAEAVIAEVQKLKWAPEKVAVSGGTVGKYENIRFGITDGKQSGYIEIVRPAKDPTGSTASMMPPKDQKAMKESSGAATYLDPDGDVIVIVMVDGGKTAVAKKLLDKLVQK